MRDSGGPFHQQVEHVRSRLTAQVDREPQESELAGRRLPQRGQMRLVEHAARIAAVLAALLWLVAMPEAARAANCGGTVVCQCGDTVTSNYTMTADLICPRLSSGETVGLQLKSGATLDCQSLDVDGHAQRHTITGPGDRQKSSYGIRAGRSSVPDANMVIRNCDVTKFWWGVYVQNAGDVLIEDNHLYENGWKDPTQNGTGYGLDVANSQDVTVRRNRIVDNGNEGFHLSTSVGVTVDDNELVNNGREQLYMIHADFNIIRNNYTQGGTQGLEMRYSSNNRFSYNVWAQAPLHMLDNDNNGNVFFYDRFEGRVFVGNRSVGNRFELSEFINPTGNCLSVDTLNATYVYKSYFRSCSWDVFLVTSAPVTLDRSVATLAKMSEGVTIKFPGCTADFDLDATVDPNERGVVQAAMGSVIGGPNWDPEADLNHDGKVDTDDLDVFDGQLGPCAANLVVTTLDNPPPTATPGSFVSVSNTVQNQSRIPAGPSRTQYYLSLDTVKGAGDKLLGGRAVPPLGAYATSTASLQLMVPTSTVFGTYYLLACVDDTELVPETDEAGNCRASASTVQIGRPDLTISEVINPSTAVPGVDFQVSDTVENQTAFSAGASRTRYYLSGDPLRNTGDRPLSGFRPVPLLLAGKVSAGSATVTIPNGTPLATYYLLACADDGGVVPERDETNNCLASPTPIQVGRPDLLIAAVTDPSATAVRGTSIQVTATVQNPTVFDATAKFRVQYYLSLDGLKNSGDRLLTGYRTMTGLAAGESLPVTTSVTIPAATPTGDYFLLVCADDTFQLVEKDETNNCRASAAKLKVTL